MTEPQLLPVDEQAQFGPLLRLPEVEVPPEEGDAFADVETDLDPRARQDFTGLLYLGYLEDTVAVAGHKFVLRTPSQDDRLEMGLLHKPYLNSMSTEPAWRVITAAAYLRAIDGNAAPEPLSPAISAMQTRLTWIRTAIYSDKVFNRLFEECLELDARVREVVDFLDGQGESSG